MSHTVSRGLTSATHWGTVACAIASTLKDIVKRKRCTGKEISPALHASIQRFFEAAKSGTEFYRTRTMRVRPIMWSISNCSIAAHAAEKASPALKNPHSFENFLYDASEFIARLAHTYTFTHKECELAKLVERFLEEIVAAGEAENETLYNEDEDD